MGSPTTNYGWTKPTVGGDTDAWGTELNSDLDSIDSTVFSVSGVANAALPKAGGTMTGALTPSQTAGIVGTTTNNNAATGAVGEYLSAVNTGAAATTNVALTVATLSLTAGDWDVEGNVGISPSAGVTYGTWSIAIGTVGNTPYWYGAGTVQIGSFTSGVTQGLSGPTGMVRVSIASTTSVFLVATAGFSSGTCQIGGTLQARRRR